MIKLSSLNGWQRIFVAFLVFIYLPISAIFMADKPYVTGLTDKEFLELTPTDLLLEMKAKKAFYINEDTKKTWDIFIESDKYLIMNYDFAYSWRYNLAIDKSIGEAKAIAMGEELGKALYENYSRKLLLIRVKNVALLIAFAVAIYAFGWTLGWIYRGFRKNKE